MRVDRTNVESLKAYRERLMLALENADYLSPVRAYEKALERCNREITADWSRALAEGRVVRYNGGMSLKSWPTVDQAQADVRMINTFGAGDASIVIA